MLVWRVVVAAILQRLGERLVAARFDALGGAHHFDQAANSSDDRTVKCGPVRHRWSMNRPSASDSAR